MVASATPPTFTATAPVYQPDGVPGGIISSTQKLRVSRAGTVAGKALRASCIHGSTAGIRASGMTPTAQLRSDGVTTD